MKLATFLIAVGVGLLACVMAVLIGVFLISVFRHDPLLGVMIVAVITGMTLVFVGFERWPEILVMPPEETDEWAGW